MAKGKGKKTKQIKSRYDSSGFGEKDVKCVSSGGKKRIGIEISPDSYMTKKPTWNFSRIDTEYWSIHNDFIQKIMPTLIDFERMTGHEIVSASKGHGSGSKSHSVEIRRLIKKAQERLLELHIHDDSLMSLRMTGKDRLWGVLDSGSFYILWYDSKHEICPSNNK